MNRKGFLVSLVDSALSTAEPLPRLPKLRLDKIIPRDGLFKATRRDELKLACILSLNVRIYTLFFLLPDKGSTKATDI
jgi:hypothetical protein